MENVSDLVNSYNSENILKKKITKMAVQQKYYNSIKFMVHMTDNKYTRQMMISQISYANPYLCAQIIMTICEDTQDEEKYLLDTILKRLDRVSNNYKRVFLLMALVELGENEKFGEALLKNNDLINYKTFRIFLNNFNIKQQLVLIRILLNAGTSRYVSTIIQNLEKCYSSENDLEAIDLAKTLIDRGELTIAYKLMKLVKFDYDVSKILGLKKEYIKSLLLKKAPLSSPDDFEIYLNAEYGFSRKDADDSVAWKIIIDNENVSIYGSALDNLLKKYLKENLLSNNTILNILRMRGINEDYIDENAADEYLYNLLKKKDTVHGEPFYSLMQNENEILGFLNSGKFINKYQFNEDAKLNLNTTHNIDLTKVPYEYFDQCVKSFKSSENLIRVYFNTPLKCTINLEYLINALKKKFDCDESRIRFLLGDYVFKGKVCKVNENSVSIRPFNIWTLKPCRFNTKKYWVSDGEERHIVKVGDILYFKYNYMASDSEKINVHFPELSLERMHETEENRRSKKNDK